MKFCLFTAGSAAKPTTERVEFAFFAHKVEDLLDSERRFALTAEDIALLNPGTRTCPVFRSSRDTEILKRIHRNVPVVGAQKGERDWGLEIFQKMIDVTIHASLCSFTAEPPDAAWLPVYEGRLLRHFNHRAATYEGVSDADREAGNARELTLAELNNPDVSIRPSCWVTNTTFIDRLGGRTSGMKWFPSVRYVTNTTNERTVMVGIRPFLPSNNKLATIFLRAAGADQACFVANFSSFAFDYVARQKVGGTTLGGYIIEQLPALPLRVYSESCPWTVGRRTLRDWLLSRVLELTYTAWDLEAFAQDCGWPGPPFRWDEERRFLLRCELDAAFFHLYLGPETDWRQQPAALTQAFPTPRAAASYILDTFPIVKRKDEAKFNGDYRTKRTILEIYDALAASMQTGKAYQTRLNPAPASIAVAHLPRFDRERVNFNEAGDYILPFVGSLLRHQGGECDLMKLIRAYAMLLGDRKTLSTLAEARFGAEAEEWVKRFNQPVDASWFLPILRGLDNRDVLKLEERGENDVFARLLDANVPSNPTVETDVYLLLNALDLSAVPPAAVAEQMKRIAPKPVRRALQEASALPIT